MIKLIETFSFENCPICDYKLESDATLKEFCKLCGMAKPKEYLILHDEKGISNYFCCKSCLYNYQLDLFKK